MATGGRRWAARGTCGSDRGRLGKGCEAWRGGWASLASLIRKQAIKKVEIRVEARCCHGRQWRHHGGLAGEAVVAFVDHRRGDHPTQRGWWHVSERWRWRRRLGCYPQRGALLVGAKIRGGNGVGDDERDPVASASGGVGTSRRKRPRSWAGPAAAAGGLLVGLGRLEVAWWLARWARPAGSGVPVAC